MKNFKKLFREAIGFTLIRLGFLFGSNENEVLSIYFHNPSKKLFESVARWLIKRNYSFISLSQLESFIAAKQTVKKKVILTFDDAWKGNLQLIEAFEKWQIPVTIFVPVEPVLQGNYWWEYADQEGQERLSGIASKNAYKKLPEDLFREKICLLMKQYTLSRSCMTLEEVRALANNPWITIGSHTMTHPILDNCSPESQFNELAASRKTLAEWTGKPVDYLAYPNGDFDDETVRLAQSCGYTLAFSIQPARIDLKTVNPFRIPRYAINDEGGYFENIAKVMGIWQKILG